MGKKIENTMVDAISNATSNLAKAKLAVEGALELVNCDDYNHLEGVPDFIQNSFCCKTPSGQAIAEIAHDYNRLKTLVNIVFDYVHQTLSDLEAVEDERKELPVNLHAPDCILSRDIDEASHIEKAHLMKLSDWTDACTCGQSQMEGPSS